MRRKICFAVFGMCLFLIVGTYGAIETESIPEITGWIRVGVLIAGMIMSMLIGKLYEWE